MLRNRRQLCYPLVLLASPLVASGWLPTATAQDRFIRSVADQLPRPSDELARPRQVERNSHHGWELSNANINVVSLGSPEQATFAMQEARAAWAQMSELADYLSVRQRNPDFGLGAVQVVINRDPPKARNQSNVLAQVVGTQISIELYPQNEAQLQDLRQPLRAAVAASLLRTAEIDRHIPAWMTEGLALYAASQSLADQGVSPEEIAKSSATMPAGGIGLFEWRGKRSAPDKLEPAIDVAAVSTSQAANQMLFVLTAEDGKHAAQFLQILRQVIDQGNRTALSDRPVRTRPEQIPEPVVPQSVSNYLATLRDEYPRWQEDPLMGTPRLAGELSPDEEVAAKQQQLLFLLKMARRLQTSETVRSSEKSSVKVTEFNRDERTATAVPTRRSSLTVPNIASTADLLEHLDRLYGNQPYSTLAPNGHLLISNYHRADLEAFLAVENRDIRFLQENNTLKVSIPLNDRESLVAWLEEDAKNPNRPIAKFGLQAKGSAVKAASAVAPVTKK
ncbi:MAG: hypothetical protein ACO1RA_12340 [Planctomycetaceae bacterium]